MTDEQMIKEIIDRRMWGTTRVSDFDWLMNYIEKQRKEIKYLREANFINREVNQPMIEEILRLQAELIQSYEMQVRGMVYGRQLEWVKNRIRELTNWE